MAQKKTITVKPYKRSKPSQKKRKNPGKGKPGPKTVTVKRHKRTISK